MSNNPTWAYHIINQLCENKITYFCIAPGSRSTPLALAVAKHKKAKAFIHHDERALAFHALGYSKVTKKASVIIVTSGTALGNLYPAIMEAFHSNIPLVILTADRPFEELNRGSNQTTNQTDFFGSFVKHSLDIPTPSPNISISSLCSSVGFAIAKAQDSSPGPVRIN